MIGQYNKMKSAADFKQELMTLADDIETMHIAIRNDEELDLEGLDDRVDLLCQQIEAAPSDISTEIESEMAQMITALEKLAVTLKSITEGDDE
ncbi:MAG: hypothetical protein CMH30_08720 [Micavibrio sp.]|nr:hypothetical protein [Micavibrio sp.]|tara:strand:- start:4644 stop:4922 length:279 start_codon:yes stop_codon:yes gene_type:complete